MGTPTGSTPSPGPIWMVTDGPDASVFVGLGAIFILGFALLILATWYAARRGQR